jgi:hypothetical protein
MGKDKTNKLLNDLIISNTKIDGTFGHLIFQENNGALTENKINLNYHQQLRNCF